MRIAILLFLATTTASAALACEHPYVLHRGGDTSGCGDMRQFKRVERDGDVFRFQRNGHDYFVRDAATLDRLERLFEPQLAIGRQESELGRQQSALGHQQSELGRKQSDLGRQQADADRERQRELSRQQHELSEEQAALGSQQRALGEKQRELGRRQSVLAHELERQLQTIEDDLLRNGSARAE